MKTRTLTKRQEPAQTARKSMWRDSRGAVMVEYALLLTFVAVPSVIGLTAAGVILYDGYIAQRDTLLLPSP